MPIDLHMVIDIDDRFLPRSQFIPRSRQGSQRGPVYLLITFPTTARQLLEGLVIDSFNAIGWPRSVPPG
jgi:hypothetical protein